MKLREYMERIVTSTSKDWTAIHCWGGGSGPSYRDQLQVTEYFGKRTGRELNVESHAMVASLRDDLSITIAWGLTSNDNFKEEWANGFPDPHASSSWVDFFYNGALVYRELYVTVDGGRVKLPLPDRRGDRLVAPNAYAALCALLMSFESRYDEDLQRYLGKAGIELVDEPWPRI